MMGLVGGVRGASPHIALEVQAVRAFVIAAHRFAS
jgi:hypothetical protein